MKVGIRILLIAAPLIALLVVAIRFSVARTPGYKIRLDQFQNELADATTPLQLQQWAMSRVALEGGNSKLTYPEFLALPAFGAPSYLEILDSNGSPYVYAHWGDGFGHWGIIVGDQQLPFPRGDDHVYIEWRPGVFVWHELQ